MATAASGPKRTRLRTRAPRCDPPALGPRRASSAAIIGRGNTSAPLRSRMAQAPTSPVETERRNINEIAPPTRIIMTPQLYSGMRDCLTDRLTARPPDRPID